MTADGRYDGEAIFDAVVARRPGAVVIIPPWATVVADEAQATQRDLQFATIEKHGRMA